MMIIATAVLAGSMACMTPGVSQSGEVLERVLQMGSTGKAAVRDAAILDSGLELEARLQGAGQGGTPDLRPGAPSRLAECLHSTAGALFSQALKARASARWDHEASPDTDEASIPIGAEFLVVRIDSRRGSVLALRVPRGLTLDDLVAKCAATRARQPAEREVAAFVARVVADVDALLTAGRYRGLAGYVAAPGVQCGPDFANDATILQALEDRSSDLSARLQRLSDRGRASLRYWEVQSDPRFVDIIIAFDSEEVPFTVWRRASGWVVTAGLLCGK